MTTTPSIVDLPDRRDVAGLGHTGLVGREELLAKLAEKLSETTGELALTSASSTLAVHGGGGIGKTALALEYCHTRAVPAGYDLIWWVNADSEATLGSSFQSLVEQLGGDAEQPDVNVEVNRLLAMHQKWLAVFDNVDSRASFDSWRPKPTNGSMLVTTRSTAQWDQGRSIPVDVIAPEDARAWLLQAAADTLDVAEPAAVDELVDELGGLALALTMAAAYIHNTPVSLTEYLRLFKAAPAPLLDDPTVDVGNYDKTVYSALAVTREQLKATNQDAALLMLEYASFYAPDDIPMFLFTPEGLSVASEVEVNQAKRALAERSLIIPRGTDAFDVHRLVQSVTRHYLEHPRPQPQLEPGPTVESRSRGRSLPSAELAKHRIVVVAANSIEAPLNIGEELRNIRDALEHFDHFEVVFAHSARPDDLTREVVTDTVAIVHFSGHGTQAGIYLKDDDGERHRLVPGARLEQFFDGRGVQLVILNSCYSGEQAEAIARSVRTVIGTPIALDDEAAHRFSKAFYRSLGRGHTIRSALKDGRDTVGLYDLDDEFVCHGDLDYGFPPGTKLPGVRSGVDTPGHEPDPQPKAAGKKDPPTPSPGAPTPAQSGPPPVDGGRKRLEAGYYVAGIVVAVVAVITLAISLWPSGEPGPSPDPSGPSTSTTSAD
jgi:hypothetical protein